MCLSSCSHEVWPNEVDFFTPFKVWQTETKELVVACQNAGGDLGFGQITYLNEKFDAKVSFVTRSLSGFSSNVLISFTNDSGESIALSYKKRRIKKDLFSYYNDRFELYNLEQESLDEYWNSKSIILYSRDMENEELDARYYAGWSFVNKNEGLIFGSIPEKEPREWVLKTTTNEEYHLVFTDKRSLLPERKPGGKR